MITTLQNTICTAILYLLLATGAYYLVSHAPSFAEPLRDSLEHAASIR